MERHHHPPGLHLPLEEVGHALELEEPEVELDVDHLGVGQPERLFEGGQVG